MSGTIASRVMVFTAARVAGSASVIALFVLLSRLLDTEQYGSFRQVWLLNRGLLDILGCGIPLSIYYFLPKLVEAQRRTLIRQSLLLLAALGVALSAALFVAAGAIGRAFDNPALPPLLQIFALYPLFALPVTAAESAMISLGRTGEFSLFFLLDRVGLVATAAAAVLIGESLSGLFLALVGFGAVELLAAAWLLERATRPLPRAAPRWNAGEQLRFALPTGLSNMVEVVNLEVDKLITAAFFTVSQFASYANGAFEVPIFGVVVSSVSAVLMPEYAGRYRAGDRGGLLALWHGTLTRTALVLVPAAGYLFLFAPDLIALLFSSRYADSVAIFQIYLAGLLPKLAWYGPTLVAMGHNRAPLYGSLIAIACNAALSLVLLRRVGLAGPALASVITGHLLLLYYVALFAGRLEVPWWRVLPLGALARIAALSAVAGLVAWPVTRLETLGGIGRLALGALVFGAASLGLLWRAGLLRAEDLRALHFRVRTPAPASASEGER